MPQGLLRHRHRKSGAGIHEQEFFLNTESSLVAAGGRGIRLHLKRFQEISNEEGTGPVTQYPDGGETQGPPAGALTSPEKSVGCWSSKTTHVSRLPEGRGDSPATPATKPGPGIQTGAVSRGSWFVPRSA